MIVDNLPGVEITVTVDGVPLEEHVDDEATVDELSCTRYIRATSGSKFCISTRIEQDTLILGDYLMLKITIDGRQVAGRTYLT